MKLLGLIQTILLLAFCHPALGTEGTVVTPATPPSPPPMDVFAYDCSQLAKLPPEQAIEQLEKVTKFYGWAIATGNEEERERKRAKNPDLPMEAARWTALNPALPGYFETMLKELPITYENRSKRGWVFRELETLPAEWALRLIVRTGLVEGEVVTSSEYDFTDEETLARFMLTDDGRDPRRLTNRIAARSTLRWMKFPGADQCPEGVDLPEWISSLTQPEVEALLRSKWGKWTVLNAELGLGPDNRPLPAPPKPADQAPAPPPLATTPPPPAPPSPAAPARLLLPGLAAVLVLLAAALIWWLRKKGSRGESE